MPFELIDTRIEGVRPIQAKLAGEERKLFVETYRAIEHRAG
jgi:dTDP-4-dehydrorhamnose 3,5-epimerase-like enzyme